MITLTEFEKLVKGRLKYNWDREIKKSVTGNLMGYIMTTGFPKLDNTNFTTFVKSLQDCITFDEVVVNVNGTRYLISNTKCEIV